jgi:AsmA protein
MQETDTYSGQSAHEGHEAEQSPAARRRFWRRFIPVCLLLVALVLLAVLPPLVNVSRFKRRIATSISSSLGRPVHLDSVSLLLLPFPAFRLENFVVAEDPAFGAEPVMRANTVEARLRVSSLWRRKVEFSKISLQEPSINLVHMPNGRWNVEAILLQAARIPAAPTAQVKAGPDPRFPYIEATGARVNIKAGDEKLPLSLTEADFALWLPNPQQWHLRVVGKPSRTDTNALDTGRISLEGTLGHAPSFDQIPLDISAEWRSVPLGEASRVVLGRDAGLRGDLRLRASVHGTISNSAVKASLELDGVRRAEFVPQHLLEIRAECQATAAEAFHAFHGIQCSWPPATEAHAPAPDALGLTGEVPDIHHLENASFEIGTPKLPASVLLDWLRVASARVPAEVTATGALTARLNRDSAASGLVTSSLLSGRFELSGTNLSGGPLGDSVVAVGDVSIASNEKPVAVALKGARRRAKPPVAQKSPDGGFVMLPVTLQLGGKDPAMLDGRFDRAGYTLHLTGSVSTARLLALAAAVPQFGDGLRSLLVPQGSSGEADGLVNVNLTSTRAWGARQQWSGTVVRAVTAKRR